MLEAERALGVVERRRQRGGRTANAGKNAFIVAQAKIDDANKVALTKWAHSCLSIGKIAFDKFAIDRSWNIVCEIEIGIWLDKREIMAVARGIGNDPFDPGDSVKAPAPSLYRLIIDGPVAFELAGARQIGLRELILPIRLVGIMRIAAMDEDPGHRAWLADELWLGDA